MQEQIAALEALERWDDAFAVRVTYAHHDRDNLHARYDVAWIHLVRDQAEQAAQWLREAAADGVGCDRDLPLEARVAEVAEGLLSALRSHGSEAEADALEAALGLPRA